MGSSVDGVDHVGAGIAPLGQHPFAVDEQAIQAAVGFEALNAVKYKFLRYSYKIDMY
jgi:hypothetical protein